MRASSAWGGDVLVVWFAGGAGSSRPAATATCRLDHSPALSRSSTSSKPPSHCLRGTRSSA